ncbi:MAG: glycine betaine/L-proline ABC transporter substrate-binding protein ProX [Dehalogenimonas sp.]|uniref:Glycine betaine/L-proline ABC transporter substrate-binding protein ProX n=1 Tax=Candidatus Dehalogenimonas loeffleri TaxID=3127115 RepID=A0ABZ2J1W2_9CHLR|nr:glycine betaine/L-proline ABC transporter substrate-binding protein ProX [Dehalogenimonas sp.]
MNSKMRKLLLVGFTVVLSLSLLVTGCSDDSTDDGPGNGTTVNVAQPTWDTGWFQTEVFIQALEKLGYDVKDPITLDNPVFYNAIATGDVDFWADGWFPLHNQYLSIIEGKGEVVGEFAMGGALQGYLIDKATSEQYGITSIEDFKDPEIAALFDTDNDDKANMVACPPGWGCEAVILHQMEAYGLNDYINATQAAYNTAMADVVARYNAGEPVFFYTWTPNWTVNELVPGEDVVWLEVPFSTLPADQSDLEDETFVANLVGKAGAAEPFNMGWPANNIQVVANSAFLNANPAAAYILKNLQIPLEDIFAQNYEMFQGENRPEDIVQDANEWIAANQTLFDSWIQGAIDAAS